MRNNNVVKVLSCQGCGVLCPTGDIEHTPGCRMAQYDASEEEQRIEWEKLRRWNRWAAVPARRLATKPEAM